MITDEQAREFLEAYSKAHATKWWLVVSQDDVIAIKSALEDYEESKWIDEKYAPKGVPVLVYGGVAMKRTGGKWYTGMGTPLFKREIQWKVTKFQYLPPLPLPKGGINVTC